MAANEAFPCTYSTLCRPESQSSSESLFWLQSTERL